MRLPRKAQATYSGTAQPAASDPGYMFEYDRVYSVETHSKVGRPAAVCIFVL